MTVLRYQDSFLSLVGKHFNPTSFGVIRISSRFYLNSTAKVDTRWIYHYLAFAPSVYQVPGHIPPKFRLGPISNYKK